MNACTLVQCKQKNTHATLPPNRCTCDQYYTRAQYHPLWVSSATPTRGAAGTSCWGRFGGARTVGPRAIRWIASLVSNFGTLRPFRWVAAKGIDFFGAGAYHGKMSTAQTQRAGGDPNWIQDAPTPTTEQGGAEPLNAWEALGIRCAVCWRRLTSALCPRCGAESPVWDGVGS